MKKLALIIFYIVFFFAALLFFTPKENLYYFAEEQLKPLNVVVASEEVIDHGFSLEIAHAAIYVQKIKSADISSLKMLLLGVYNRVDLNNIVLDKTFEQFFPVEVASLSITQNIVSPTEVSVEMQGDFGEATGDIHLVDRNGTVILTPSKLMLSRYRNTLRQLKKIDEGKYRYEFNF